MKFKSAQLVIVSLALGSGITGLGACVPAATTGAPAGSGGKGMTTGSGGSTGTPGSGGSTGTPGSGGSTTVTPGSGGSTTVTPGSGGSTVTPGSGGATVTPGSGGSGTPGTGGMPVVVQKICATKITPMNPLLVDFENYNGMVTADKYGTPYGGPMVNTGTSYMGPMSWGDGSATPTLSILAGHPPGMWGLSQTVTKASKWGMGGGFWMSCVNASTFKGISFWVRGSVPDAKFSFILHMDNTTLPDAVDPAGGGTCPGTADTCKPAAKADIPITMDWTQVQIPWADFTPGTSGTTSVVPNGDNVSGFSWSVNVPFVADPASPDPMMPSYIAMPSDLLFNLDDLSFIP